MWIKGKDYSNTTERTPRIQYVDTDSGARFYTTESSKDGFIISLDYADTYTTVEDHFATLAEADDALHTFMSEQDFLDIESPANAEAAAQAKADALAEARADNSDKTKEGEQA